jgi:membrane-associated protein
MPVHLLASASIIDPKHLVETFGFAGLLAIVFAETGLLIGFFLPGDSLLVLAGLVSAVAIPGLHRYNLALVLLGVFVAAVAGAQTGYLIGYKAGPALFNRPDSRLFKQKYVVRAQRYFDKYGAGTVIVARFIPVVRTFANPMAGVARVKPRTFFVYNLIGAALWTGLVTMLGFVLGKTVPSAQHHLGEIEGIIILLSLLPVAYEVVKHRLHPDPDPEAASAPAAE